MYPVPRLGSRGNKSTRTQRKAKKTAKNVQVAVRTDVATLLLPLWLSQLKWEASCAHALLGSEYRNNRVVSSSSSTKPDNR